MTPWQPTGTLRYRRELRDRWPEPQAQEWRREFPFLFDDDDLRITRKQPRAHFKEWFTAIRLHQKFGVHVLVEKYGMATHPRKLYALQRAPRALIEFLGSLKSVQPPDLLVFDPDWQRYWFAEIKGYEPVSERQVESHERIRRELNVPVEIIYVRPSN